MKRNRTWLLIFFVLALFLTPVEAQKKTVPATTQKKPGVKPAVQKSETDAVSDEKKVRDIVAFLEYMLNTLGSSGTPTRDKEVLITESYAKIFRDSKVQIEDDLDEERVVVTNKDIVAYLKDVNFFFSNVRFEFTIDNIAKSTLPNGDQFFKVSVKRNLKGTTISGKPVNNSQPRFIEINFNPKEQDLRIVSMYTNGIDEKRTWRSWWTGLSYEWQTIFKKQVNVKDSASLGDIKTIAAIESLDLSNNKMVRDISPLGQLSNLRSLNLSGTGVADLTPIRNLTELVNLDIAGTRVRDLSPLKYASKIQKLNISKTSISDITVVERMPDLQELDLSESSVVNLTALWQLTQVKTLYLQGNKISALGNMDKLAQLAELNLSRTHVQDLTPLRNLKQLRVLNLDSTRVNDLSPLKELEMLVSLQINFTSITSLMALKGLPRLEKIYCDQTSIKQEAADVFMAANPKVLVIFDSRDLQNWWKALTPEWQTLFRSSAHISPDPSKEELALIPMLDSINLSGRSSLRDLEPLRHLTKLQVVKASKTNIASLQSLQNHKEIVYLDICETNVSDLSVAKRFAKLKILKADKSKLMNLDGVELAAEKLYLDGTNLTDGQARSFLAKNPNCLLIYKTERLNNWWTTLSTEWKDILTQQLGSGKKPTTEQLHALIEREQLEIKGGAITNLNPLREFPQLKELSVSETALSTITPMSMLSSVRILRVTNSPIQQIDSVAFLERLEELDVSNTPLVDIYPVWRLKKLKKLNCAGTQIKRMDILEQLENLEYLDCSNTNVTKLNALDYLPLKMLKCYNTKISDRTIENFRASHPNCQVMYYR
jgi:Leucine-rich repeat (LRR) protein